MAQDIRRYKVFNINGTADNECECCGSWLEHWKTWTRSDREKCCVNGCNNDAQVGAHVMIDDQRFKRCWWIVPFCRGCNKRTDQMELDARIALVSAVVADCKAKRTEVNGLQN